jgi:hypothetical protein
MKRERPPAPIVRMSSRGLEPVTQFDSEEIAGYPIGSEFDLICRTKRSHPQLRMYWVVLGAVVEATGKWPTREALHNALKLKRGLVTLIYDLAGNPVGMQVDSTALDAMSHKEFTEYFTSAMAMLSDAVGYDVLEKRE